MQRFFQASPGFAKSNSINFRNVYILSNVKFLRSLVNILEQFGKRKWKGNAISVQQMIPLHNPDFKQLNKVEPPYNSNTFKLNK